MTMLVVASCVYFSGGARVTPPNKLPTSLYSTVQTAVSRLLQTPLTAPETARLEITPSLEGRIGSEEWDPFTTSADSKTFFQWQPGSIFVAGAGPVGSDLLVSLDLGNNGWLVGSDNVEVRVKYERDDKPIISIRRLNAKNVAGPVWEDLPAWSLSSIAKVVQEDGRISYELEICDAGLEILPRRTQKIGARVDFIPHSEPEIGPTQARVLIPISLVTNRADGLPSTLHYRVEGSQGGLAGGSASFRFDFSTPKPLPEPPAKKIEISGEGLMKDKLSNLSAPFPYFGKKTRGFVDYTSRISEGASSGYHVLKAVLSLSDDTPATVETSFLVMPSIEVDIDHPHVPNASVDRSVSIGMSIKSNLRMPVKGSLSFELDPRFKILNRSDNHERFVLEPTGRINRKVQLYVPANTKGTYPITFDIDAMGAKSKVIRFITFD